MKFKKQKIFFYSDPHFWHKHAIMHNNRPWNSTEEMNWGLINNYNLVVGKNDLVIWVGDAFFCGSSRADSIMKKLNGRKVLVSGNHDGTSEASYNCGFDFVCEKLVLKIADQEVNVVHYPYAEHKFFTILKRLLRLRPMRFLERRLVNKGKWLIHGHTHSKFRLKDKEIHVGVDAWGYRPVSMEIIETIIKTGKLPGNKTADNTFKQSILNLLKQFARNKFK